MSSDWITLDRHDGGAHLRMNRPPVNQFDSPFLEAIGGAQKFGAVQRRGLFAEFPHEIATRVGADAFPEAGPQLWAVVGPAQRTDGQIVP